MAEKPSIEEQKEWERRLKEAGMPKRLPNEHGKRVPIGLGVKTEEEELLENRGGHSRLCPLNLGYGISEKVDQPKDRPTEDAAID